MKSREVKILEKESHRCVLKSEFGEVMPVATSDCGALLFPGGA